MRHLLILLLNIITIYETSLGLLQVFEIFPSGHARFTLTGSFDNPGPYGGLIAMSLAILLAFVIKHQNVCGLCEKVLVVMSIASCSLCIILLPATQSRAAWLAFGISVLVLGFKELELAEWICRRKLLSTIITVVILLFAVGVFLMKKESAIGRFHIWHMELRAIAERPWTGHGDGTILGVYGRTQMKYFAEKSRSEVIERVAGCPEYAFNEYLKIGVEKGVPVMLAVIATLLMVVFLMLKYRSPFAYGLITFCIFAFFSYPLEAVKIESQAEREWKNVQFLSNMGLYDDAVEEYAVLYKDMKGNYKYLYDYGYALYKSGRYEKSIQILKRGCRLSSDPMFYNVLGKNYEAIENYALAESSYIHAHYMVPQRLYPLILLMRMHVRCGNNAEAVKYAEIILGKSINERHITMLDLQSEARHCLDSLNHCLQ